MKLVKFLTLFPTLYAVQLSTPLDLKATTTQLQANLLNSISSKSAEGIYNNAKALNGLSALSQDNAKAVCDFLANLELNSIANAFYYQKIDGFYQCESKLAVANTPAATEDNPEPVSTFESRISADVLAKIQENAVSDTIDIGNLYQAISVLRKSKVLAANPALKTTLAENLATVFETQSGKSVLARALVMNGLIELGGNKLGAKFIALESNINLVDNALAAAKEYDNTLLDLGENDVEINSLIVRSIVVFSKLQEKKLLLEGS